MSLLYEIIWLAAAAATTTVTTTGIVFGHFVISY
jgi:hypothetical protein